MVTPNQDVRIRERRVAWLTKLSHFRRHQNRLMPGVADVLEGEEEDRREEQLKQDGDKSTPPMEAESTLR